jgi:D-alanyl-D-alanine carboxypeptidase
MNKTAKALGLEGTNYANPHGLPHVKNRSTARDVGLLASVALKDPLFAEIVNTQLYSCYVLQSGTQAPYRKMKWCNTNRLLEKGWEGVKTGITMTAGPCLCASARRKETQLVVTVLGSKSMDRRWIEVPKLGKWAFARLGIDSSPT